MHRRADTFGSCDLLARKIYAMPECKSVEIGMQTNPNNIKNKKCSQFPHLMKLLKIVKFKAYTINQSYSVNSLNPSKIYNLLIEKF